MISILNINLIEFTLNFSNMPNVIFRIYKNEEVIFGENLIRVLEAERIYYFRANDRAFSSKNSKNESTFTFSSITQLVSFNFPNLLKFCL